jgi:hypothetical protein
LVKSPTTLRGPVKVPVTTGESPNASSPLVKVPGGSTNSVLEV